MFEEGGHEAGVGGPHPVPGEDRHGELGQVVAGEDVDGPAIHHLPGGGAAVTEEARAVGDPDTHNA